MVDTAAGISNIIHFHLLERPKVGNGNAIPLSLKSAEIATQGIFKVFTLRKTVDKKMWVRLPPN